MLADSKIDLCFKLLATLGFLAAVAVWLPPGDAETRSTVLDNPTTQALLLSRSEHAEAVNKSLQGPTAQSALAAPVRLGYRDIKKLVGSMAPEYGVDPGLAMAIIQIESAFDSNAMSNKNAQGLMQLIPETAARFGVKERLDPADNIKGGLGYLRWLLAFFKGHVPFVVAAYNAGEGAVQKHRGVPPYSETRNYVRKVTGLYKVLKHPFERDVAKPSRIMGKITVARVTPQATSTSASRRVQVQLKRA